jgi:hypothetical protein
MLCAYSNTPGKNWNGLFGLMSEHSQSLLCASTATQLVSKMLDYQKNMHAETIAKEMTRANPEYLARFNIEELLQFDSTKHSILHILKVYVERKEQTYSSDDLIVELLTKEEEQSTLRRFV